MAVRMDMKGNETRALFDLVEFEGKHVLEIGSGNGRLTWRFAHRAAHVTAIEPWTAGFEWAKRDLPAELQSRVELHNVAFEDFARQSPPATYDLVLLSWSLC